MGHPSRPTVRSDRSDRRRPSRGGRLLRMLTALLVPLAVLAVPPAAQALPPGSMSITPLEWNVVGLDSNKVEDGPHLFHIGAKVCNTGSTTLTGGTATWTWDSAASSISLDGPSVKNLPDLAPSDCVSKWFGVSVVVAKASWNTKRSFHVTAAATGAPSVSTPLTREVYVEKLVSQNRNSVTASTGATAVTLGSTYTYTFSGQTASTYEQLSAQPYFDPSIFDVLSVTKTIQTGSTTQQFYSDGCGWVPDTSSGSYRACGGTGKVGGTFTVTATVKVVGTGTTKVSSLVDDFSGSSYHYNSDFSSSIYAINVTATAPHPPVAVDDTESTDEDTAKVVPVLNNDTDVDGDTLSVASVTQPAHGSVSLVGGVVTYTPAANYHGPDSFDYVVSDGHGGADTGTVSVTVVSVNDPPKAVADSASTTVGVAKTVTVLSNDSDADNDTMTVSVPGSGAGAPSHGTVVVNGDNTVTWTPATGYHGGDVFTYTVADGHGGTDSATVTITMPNTGPTAVDDTDATTEDTAKVVAVLGNDTDPEGDALTVTGAGNGQHGTTTVNDDGTVTYTPAADWSGVDSFDYTISDGHGGTDTGTVEITVSGVNDGPKAHADSDTTNEDTAVTTPVLGNDTDADGDTLSVVSATQGGHGSTQVVGTTVVYTPAADWHGTDTYTYTVSDGHGGTDTATVTVTVTSVNDGPVAVDDGLPVQEDTATALAVRANDTDVDGDTLTVTAVTQPADGSVALSGGVVTYTPAANWHGTTTFTYTVSDGHGGTDTATVTVVVSPVDDAPVADDDSTTTAEDTATVVGVLVNDADADGDLDPTSVSVTVPASHGTTSVDPFTGAVTYTPAADWNGTDQFTYQVCDGTELCDTAVVTVTVTPVADAPVAQDDTASTPENTAEVVQVVLNDTDADGDLDPTSVQVLTGPGFGPAHGTTAVDPTTGAITYTPATDWNGTDTFSYRVCDLQPVCDQADVTVTVPELATAPVAGDDSATTDEDTATDVAVTTNDTDTDGDLDASSVTVTVDPQHGTVTAGVLPGHLAYTPTAGWHGTDTFTYEVCDATDLCDTAVVTVTVDPVNDAPVAVDDTRTTPQDTAVDVPVLDNDSDVDGDPLAVGTVTTPAHGTAVVAQGGVVTYTPASGWSGVDTFDYTVGDGHGGSDTAAVTVTVTPATPVTSPVVPPTTPVVPPTTPVVPPVTTPVTTPVTPTAPVAVKDSAVVPDSHVVTVAVLDNDLDPGAGPLKVTVPRKPAHGTVAVNGDGTVTYTQTEGAARDTFTYRICDAAGACSQAAVALRITDADYLGVEADGDRATGSSHGTVGTVGANRPGLSGVEDAGATTGTLAATGVDTVTTVAGGLGVLLLAGGVAFLTVARRRNRQV